MVSNPNATLAVSIPCVWINVEANLVVITTSLPSLRSFLRHFFPAIFDESAYAPKKYGTGGGGASGYGGHSTTGNTSKLGGSRSRYGRMDSASKEEEVLGDLEMVGVEDRRGYHHRQEQFEAGGNGEVRGTASDVGPDDGSEKAIWQTRTVTVEYGR